MTNIDPNKPAQAELYPVVPVYIQAVVSNPLTKEVLDETKELLAKVQQVAETNKQVIAEQARIRQEQRAVRQAKDRFVFINNSIRMFNEETVHYHAPQTAQEKKAEEEKSQRKWAVVLGTLLATAPAFLTGAARAVLEDIQDQYQELRTSIDKWNINKSKYAFANVSKIDGVQAKASFILKRKLDSAIYKIVFYITILFSSITAVVGGLVASKTAMACGLFLGIPSTVAYLGRLGYIHFSKRDERDAGDINKEMQNMSIKCFREYV